MAICNEEEQCFRISLIIIELPLGTYAYLMVCYCLNSINTTIEHKFLNYYSKLNTQFNFEISIFHKLSIYV